MKIIRVFLDVHMGLAFHGLKSLMREAGMKPEVIDGHVIFINRSRTKFKILTQGYLTYYDNGSRRIPLQALQHLPTVYGGRALDLHTAMSSAIRKSLEKELRRG